MSMISILSGTDIIGDGTEEAPYEISCVDHLQWLTITEDVWNCYFIQTADIDMSETINWELRDHDNNPNTPDSTVGFRPVGTEENPFTGSYNGQNYYISNLYINRPLEIAALFKYCQGSTIRNIIMRDAKIRGKYSASVCGEANPLKIYQCYSDAELFAEEDAGGICLKNRGLRFEECTFEGSISAGRSAGGICNSIELSYILRCTFKGKIDAKHAAGIVNNSFESTIKHCFSNGFIYGEEQAAGIALDSWSSHYYSGLYYLSKIENCVSNSITISDGNASGIAMVCTNTKFLKNHNRGNVAGQITTGLINYASESLISNCSTMGDLGIRNDSIFSIRTSGLIDVTCETTISECYSSGKLSASLISVGLINSTLNDTIQNSYVKATININTVAAALATQYSNSHIRNFIFSGRFDSLETGSCIFIYYDDIDNSVVSNIFWDNDSSNVFSFLYRHNSDIDNLGLTHSQMTNISTYTDLSNDFLDTPFDFVYNPFDDTLDEDIWNINPDINNGYPYLVNNPPTTVNPISGEDEYADFGFSVPEILEVSGNYPNPFNPTTSIEYSLADPARITLEIYNVKGQKVKTIDEGLTPRGLHVIVWNGDNENNDPVASGVYFYNFKVNGKSKKLRKCMLLK